MTGYERGLATKAVKDVSRYDVLTSGLVAKLDVDYSSRPRLRIYCLSVTPIPRRECDSEHIATHVHPPSITSSLVDTTIL